MTNEEAIKIIKKYDVNGCGYCHQGGDEVEEAFQMAISALENQKKDTAEVKSIVYGEWIIDKHNRVAQCSVCNKVSPYDYGDFCKWCGADMRKEKTE